MIIDAREDALSQPTTQHTAGPVTGDAAGRRPRRVRAAKLGTTVVEQLVDDIVKGALRPGSTLPPEPELCEEFGVSRTVIRESVKVIQEKGLVRIEHGRGTQVTDPRQWNLLDDVVLTAVITHDENATFLDELVEVRTALEADMAAAAAGARTREDEERIGAELAVMRANLASPPDFAAADVRFHDMIMAASRNRLSRAIVNSIHDKARTSMRYHGEYNEAVMRQTLDEHQAISDAIASGDQEAAAAAMRTHIIDSWTRRRPSR